MITKENQGDDFTVLSVVNTPPAKKACIETTKTSPLGSLPRERLPLKNQLVR